MYRAIKQAVKTIVRMAIATPTPVVQVPAYTLIHDASVLRHDGLIIAAVATSPEGENFIFVDDYFQSFDEVTKEALIAHECGHIASRHLEQLAPGSVTQDVLNERMQCIKEGRVQRIELEADAYAAQVVGTDNMIHALNQVLTLRFLPTPTRNELYQRIEALSK